MFLTLKEMQTKNTMQPSVLLSIYNPMNQPDNHQMLKSCCRVLKKSLVAPFGSTASCRRIALADFNMM